ncbi:MAG: hypothetical protein ACLGGX_06575 [Bdellovibrionia bacterium]
MLRYWLLALVTMSPLLSKIALGQTLSQNETVFSQTMKAPSQKSKHHFSWSTSILGMNSLNQSEQRQLIDFRLRLKGDSELSSWLGLNFEAGLRMQNGNSQTLNSSDNNQNRVVLEQAALQITPHKSLIVSAGALSMRTTHSPLAIDSMPFPAARLTHKHIWSPQFYTALFVESAIPTNATLATDTEEFEKTPSLNTIGFMTRSLWGQQGEFKARASFAQWKNLAGNVASKSGFLGNSISPVTEEIAAFDYDYSVYDLGMLVNIDVANSISMGLFGEGLYNQSAPESMNQAYQVGAQLGLHLGSTDYLIKGFGYRIEPDATVAYYGPTVLFNTNRIGYGAELELDFKNFSVITRYTEAELLFEDPDQSREKSVFVKLETDYADF